MATLQVIALALPLRGRLMRWLAHAAIRRPRLTAAGLHLVLSACVGLALAALIFGLWFPPLLWGLTGSLRLFGLLVMVDVVVGPALTLVAFNPSKSRRHLRRDLTVIAVLQLVALGIGLHAVWLARPVVIAFEVDALRVVAAADIDPVLLERADPAWRSLSLTGPRFVAAVAPTQPLARFESVELALAGADLAAQPATWQAMAATHVEAMWRKAAALSDARRRLAATPRALQDFNAAVARGAEATDELRAIAITARQAAWTALIDRQGSIRATIAVDIP